MKRFIALLVCLICSFALHAQTLTTSDSALNTGAATSTSFTAPNGNTNNPIVPLKTNSGTSLWQLVPSPWGVSSGSGTLSMAYSGTGSIVTSVNLKGLNSTAVNGYPFIFYGGDSWGDQVGGQPPKFPAQLSNMSSLVTDVDYILACTTCGGDMDVMFDQYLIPSGSYTGGTGGALEVSIFLYLNFAEFGGTPTTTITTPITVNGATTNMTWAVYEPSPSAGNQVIIAPASSVGFTSGEVVFDQLPLLNEAAKLASMSGWWLAGTEFGTEFGDGATENFTFTLSKYQMAQTLGTVGPPPPPPPPPSVSITTSSVPSGQVGVFYTSTTLAASGGTKPYSWSATGLAPGLAFSSGMIFGTPTSAGTFPETFTVTDSSSPVETASVTFPVTIVPAAGPPPSGEQLVSITVTPSNFTGSVGATQQLTAIANYGDGSKGSVTGTVSWKSSAPNYVSVSASGLAKVIRTGRAATITASVSGTGTVN